MNTILSNALIFTNDEKNTICQASVAIEGEKIAEIGTLDSLCAKYSPAKVFDAKGRLLMPGFINTHMHFYGTYARGLALSASPSNFSEILSMLWWKLDSILDREAIYYSALVPCITAIQCGITSLIDHHASPHAIEGSLDIIEEAMAFVGLSGVLCYEISDRDGKEIARQGLKENERYIEKCKKAKEKNPQHPFDGMVGLHASFTLDDDTLQQASCIKKQTKQGCHIHLLEDKSDEEKTRARYKTGVVERLYSYEILGENTIAAHGVHLNEKDKKIIAETKTILVHNPQSNMNNAVGRADIFSLLEQGIVVGLGTDGMTPDVKKEALAAYLLHKHDLKDPRVGFAQTKAMLLKNNPWIYQKLTGKNVGRIQPGYLANLILVDYYPPTPICGENFWGHFLFGILEAPVDTTIIQGKVVMQNKQIPLDIEKIAFQSRSIAEKIWKKF